MLIRVSDRPLPAAQQPWRMSDRADRASAAIADRHYNRQKIGTRQFMPPGRCLVLHCETPTGRAVWGTSWPFAEYVLHQWAGAWICSLFRNEGAARATDLISFAVAATLDFFGPAPTLGMVTFIDRTKVPPIMVRGERVWGWTYRKVGFVDVGETKGGLLALGLSPSAMPPPIPAIGAQGRLLATGAA